jgi:hypothetical protein
MNVRIFLVVVAIVCDWVLMGIFFREYQKDKDKTTLIFVFGLFVVFLLCLYFLLEMLGIVVVIGTSIPLII